MLALAFLPLQTRRNITRESILTMQDVTPLALSLPVARWELCFRSTDCPIIRAELSICRLCIPSKSRISLPMPSIETECHIPCSLFCLPAAIFTLHNTTYLSRGPYARRSWQLSLLAIKFSKCLHSLTKCLRHNYAILNPRRQFSSNAGGRIPIVNQYECRPIGAMADSTTWW